MAARKRPDVPEDAAAGTAAPLTDEVSLPPFETRELRDNLSRVIALPLIDQTGQAVFRANGRPMTIGACKFGVYAFYDFDGEPIYVGQSSESLGSRIGRHLTNQRTDAVAMSVLDPFEVCDVELWPLSQYHSIRRNDPQYAAAIATLNELEATVYLQALEASEFKAVLNEKIPASPTRGPLPPSVRRRIVSDAVMAVRSHPDVRLARRAATLARLAQIISERKVAPGLRRVLVTQAKRLEWLAQRRYNHFRNEPDEDDGIDDGDDG